MGYGDDVVPALERLIRDAKSINRSRLADDGVALEELVS
jgi:hypothetical protein